MSGLAPGHVIFWVTQQMRFIILFLLTTAVSGCAMARNEPTDYSDISGRVAEIFSDSDAVMLAKAAARGDVRSMARLVEKGLT